MRDGALMSLCVSQSWKARGGTGKNRCLCKGRTKQRGHFSCWRSSREQVSN